MLQERNNFTIVAILILSLVLLGCVSSQPPAENKTNISTNVSNESNLSNVTIADAGLGTELFETAQNSTENPLENAVPDVNPVGNETNPLKDIYKNPFG